MDDPPSMLLMLLVLLDGTVVGSTGDGAAAVLVVVVVVAKASVGPKKRTRSRANVNAASLVDERSCGTPRERTSIHSFNRSFVVLKSIGRDW
jgi:hypothetical protein